jgi:hypothetical protein
VHQDLAVLEGASKVTPLR